MVRKTIEFIFLTFKLFIMKRFLQSVLLSALLLCGLNLRAQVSAPDVRVDRGENYELIKMIDDNNWPYDISNNKEHVVIQGFGAVGGYYWSEETGALTINGFPFAVSDSGVVAGYYENNLGVNEAGLWSPKTKKWEFLGMNPDVPEYLQESPDYNGAWSMTNDGSKIGVMQFLSAMSTVTYVWDKENGYKKLDNGKSPQTRPNAISEDGRVVAGFAAHEDKGEWTPCYWVDGKINRIPHLFGEALNVSPNGDYICGALLNHHAFVYDIKNEKLVDPTDGIVDIDAKVLRTVAKPEKVFEEDGLRIMRLARFAAELGFSIEERTLEVAKQLCKNLKNISGERIRMELDRILASNEKYGNKEGVRIGLTLLSDLDAWQYVIPEFGVNKNNALFRGIDAAGNVSKITEYKVSNIDRLAPDKPVAAADITTLTNQNVTVILF